MKMATHWYLAGGMVLIGGGIVAWYVTSHKEVLPHPAASGNGTNSKPGSTTITEPNWNDPFNIKLESQAKKFLAPRKIMTLSPQVATMLAEKIYNARGQWFFSDDDEDAIGDVFSRILKDKIQVSIVAAAFRRRYAQDLEPFLSGFLSKSEMQQYVHNPIQQLPGYRPA